MYPLGSIHGVKFQIYLWWGGVDPWNCASFICVKLESLDVAARVREATLNIVEKPVKIPPL
jgi:hypothetical protein